MEVILLESVTKLGRKFEVKKVKNGYGRNFLISRGLAMVATPGNKKKLEQLKAHEARVESRRRTAAAENISSLADQIVTIKATVNEKGHLFEGLHEEQIAAAIADQLKVEIAPDWIKLPKPIKNVGSYTLDVNQGDVAATFKLAVEKLD